MKYKFHLEMHGKPSHIACSASQCHPLASTNEKHLLTDCHIAYQLTPLLNLPEVTPEKFLMPIVQIFMS